MKSKSTFKENIKEANGQLSCLVVGCSSADEEINKDTREENK